MEFVFLVLRGNPANYKSGSFLDILKDENPAKFFFFHDPLVDYGLCLDYWLLCAYVVYLLLLLYCGALIGCRAVYKN